MPKTNLAPEKPSPQTGIVAVNRIPRQDLHLETASHLARFVASLEPGARLPTELELCTQLGVGRSTLREAIRALSFIGAVRVRQGSGMYVSGLEDSKVDRLIGLGLMVQRSRIQEVIEVRQILEAQAVRMAAKHHDASDREELQAIMSNMAAAIDNPLDASRYDLQYHVRLARASHNSVMEHLINGMRALFEIWMHHAVNSRPVIEEILLEHNSVLDAVFARDADLAAARMIVHLTNAADRLFSVIGKDQSAADYISLLLTGSQRQS